jgi:UDP-2,3-diacylglucosamine pyrophosphatase LpxH
MRFAVAPSSEPRDRNDAAIQASPAPTPVGLSAKSDPGDATAAEDGAPTARGDRLWFRAIWISDTHLGTPACRADALLEFLRRTDSEYLYLVGDIVDGWQLKQRWFWHSSHNDVIQKLLRKARKGCKVIYVPGNHDEAARDFLGHAFGEIAIQDEAVHTTANGTRLLVIHGDFFDAVVQLAPWIASLIDSMYSFLLNINRHFNALRARLGFPHWSLAKFVNCNVKNAVAYITAFEEALAREARRRGFDGVVCGHIHKAELRLIDGILYCNDGDWVDSLTALVETSAGTLRLLHWDELQDEASGAPDKNELDREAVRRDGAYAT